MDCILDYLNRKNTHLHVHFIKCPLHFPGKSRHENTPSLFDVKHTEKSCLSVDGHYHENGDSWHDGCRLCYCYGGQEMCALISCPRPSCSTPVFRLGDCCPSCPGEFLEWFLGANTFLCWSQVIQYKWKNISTVFFFA